MNTRTGQAHSLLHCHFESALRALAVARPGELERLPPVFESPGYARAIPAGRLSMLDDQVGRLAHGQDIFTRDVFTEVVRQLAGEMTSSGIRHVDLRVGVLMRRWPWIGSLADAIRAFKAAMPSPEALTVSFLGAVNLSKPRDVLDAVGICLDMCPVSNTRLGVWDWTRSSPAAKAMRLGLPVTINTDDPLLFSAGLTANLALSGLSPTQLEEARLAGNRYGYQP